MAKLRVITIIDDDASVRQATARLVRSLGYRADVFASAEEYLQSGRVRETSCLIADLHMPGMNGADLQDRLTAEGYRVPIVFMTAYFEEKTRDRVMQAGALGFLRKPFDNASLVKHLEMAFKEAGPDAEL